MVTDHAVEQYRRRHRPELSYDEARNELAAAAPGAVFEREQYKGKTYLLPALACYAIMIDEGDVRTMITVLPRHVFSHTHADRLAADADLRAASQAADDARAEQAKAKANAKTLSQLASVRTPGVTHAIAVQAREHYRKAISEGDAKQWELGILKMEVRLANEQSEERNKRNLRALALAVRALHGDANPYLVLKAITEIDPYLTSPTFYDRKPGEPE